MFAGSDGHERLAYSGTHEATKFNEPRSGHVLLVEIECRGAVPKLTSIPTGGFQWQVIEEEFREPGDTARLRQKLEAIAEPARTLLDLRLSGLLFADDQPEIDRCGELLEARFFYGRISSTLLPPPSDDRWLDSLPSGVLREVAVELRQLAGPLAPRGAYDYATPQVAGQSLLQLYRLMQEAAR